MKKVLVIGMLDSIHLSRWLSQFEDQSIVFTLYPSTKFKSVHPDLLRLVRSNINYHFTQKRLISLFGYKEFFFNKFLSRIFRRFSSKKRLARLIERSEFDYIHALEIQGAGYLLLDTQFKNSNQAKKVIVTNWGSDIYHFEKNLADKVRIQKVLKLADYYSAECHRDYELALKNGFSGKFLPINPNAGGFELEVINRNVKPSYKRELIVVKCYGGQFGLGEMTIDVLSKFLSENDFYKVFLYSVTQDLLEKVEELVKVFPKRVSFSTVRNKLSRDEMFRKFSDAAVYVGASRSDGISTSFLEALVLGAYPIQTNTACGNEWIQKGFKATMVAPDEVAIAKAIYELPSLFELEKFRNVNKELAIKHLSYSQIKIDSLRFYGIE